MRAGEPVAVDPSLGGSTPGTPAAVKRAAAGILQLPFSMTAALAYTTGYRAI